MYYMDIDVATENTESDILITDIFQALDLVANNPKVYRVVSIASPMGNSSYMSRPGAVINMYAAREILYLEFDDVTEDLAKCIVGYGPVQLATREDCIKALDFLGKGGKRLVHCRAGISRSTAITLGHLLSEHRSYREAVDRLFDIRACSVPNAHVVKLMCEILGRKKEYKDIMDYIYSKRVYGVCDGGDIPRIAEKHWGES